MYSKWKYLQDEYGDFNNEYEYEDEMTNQQLKPDDDVPFKKAIVSPDNALRLENEALRAEVNRLQGRNPTLSEAEKPWPKTETILLWNSKEVMRELGERIGLREQDILKFKFKYPKVTITIQINEDGTTELLTTVVDLV